MRMLDLFSGAGGAAVGYAQAARELGIDLDITGVDIAPQPRYPFRFVQADAMTFPLDGFDVIHASPPCQAHSVASNRAKAQGKVYTTGWMLDATYQRLRATSAAWVVENVGNAKMHNPLMLCGSTFGLRVIRHRLFDSSHLLFAPGVCRHTRGATKRGEYITVAGNGHQKYQPYHSFEDRQSAMGIDWMNRYEITQAIPPAYTRWIGLQLFPALTRQEVA
jgi:DNA (cytosine-5)-methyltransferase 1